MKKYEIEIEIEITCVLDFIVTMMFIFIRCGRVIADDIAYAKFRKSL